MAEHRTKKQKRMATAHRVSGVAEIGRPVTTGPLVFSLRDQTKPVQKKTSTPSVFQDSELASYTKRDLTRTGIVSFILLAVLVGIFQYLRYNG